MATYVDNFDRDNESPILAPWELCVGAGLGTNPARIVSQQFAAGVGTRTISILSGIEFENDQSASVEVISGNSTNYFGPAVRASANGDCYFVGWQETQNRLQIAKRIGGTVTEFDNVGSVGFVSGDKLTLSIAGSVLTVLINDVVYNTYTDADNSLASGVVGIYAQGDLTRFDNFSATGVAPAFSIVNVDTDNTVTDGQQNVPFTVAGFAGDITSASLRVGADTISLTGLTGTGTSYTVNLPDIAALVASTQGVPFSTQAYQVEFVATDGTDTAAINITREPKAGHTVVDIVDGVAIEGSAFETRVGGAPFDGSQLLLPPNFSSTAAGIITGPAEDATFHCWDVTSKSWDIVTYLGAEEVTTPAPTVSISAIGTLTEGDTGTATATTTNTNSVAWSATGSVSINASTGAYTVDNAGTWSITATATGDGGSVSDTASGTAEAVTVDSVTSTATITIAGINGSQAIKIYNDVTDVVLYTGNVTLTDGVGSVSVEAAVGTVFTGRWLGTNPPTTGTGLYGVTA
tara:strand:- start:740 stop:2299 length:1560 start_codon:yes stop_codon:yes gene_type:complete